MKKIKEDIKKNTYREMKTEIWHTKIYGVGSGAKMVEE